MRGNALTFIKSQNSHFHKYSSSLIGITLVILSGFLLSINGAIGKYLGQDLHPLGGVGIRMRRPGLHVINGFFFTFALFGWFWALPRIPLDLNTAVGFTTPIFAVLGAIIFLGEKSEPWRWGALVVGIIGALIIIRPTIYGIPPGVLAAVFSALCFAVTKLLTKVITKSDAPESIVFSQAFWVTVFAFPVAVYFWENPNLEQFIWIILLSIVTIMNHFAITWAIKLSDIGVIEPVTFTRLIWSALVGYLIFAFISLGESGKNKKLLALNHKSLKEHVI